MKPRPYLCIKGHTFFIILNYQISNISNLGSQAVYEFAKIIPVHFFFSENVLQTEL